MSLADTLPSLSLFMRYTDGDGKTRVQEHRVWSKERFIAAREAEAAQANTKDGKTKHRAEQITEDQYAKERK